LEADLILLLYTNNCSLTKLLTNQVSRITEYIIGVL
jgi:hypothetical protein